MQRTTIAVLLGLAASSSFAGAAGEGRTVHYTVGTKTFGLHVPAQGMAPLATPAADTHIIFMNKCPAGCVVASGNTDNRTDKSDIGHGTLSAFNGSASEWSMVMSCMQNTFSRFNVTISDVDPGTAPHLEVMVAGLGAQIGEPSGVLGVADFPCDPSQTTSCPTYIPNALVFAFANDNYYATRGSALNNANEICATAAQEIAHTWALDHVVDASDPLTYNDYTVGGVINIRQYKDNQTCGSDCQGGQSPFGLACSGSGGQATHRCALGATQNEVSLITSLFGGGAPDTTAPTVTITSPANNASVMPGFAISATGMDNGGLGQLEAKLDGNSLGADSSAPYKWTAPSTLTQGSHHLVVTATDLSGNTGMAAIDVIYGAGCTTNADCADQTQICDHGACVAGPNSAGGLGSPCTANTDCASGSCGNDGAGNQYCVSSCDPTASTCPGGFQCLDTGGGAGVCWPGETAGTGGCNTSGSGGGGFLLFGLGALIVSRRKRA